jgi:hypothetical protein
MRRHQRTKDNSRHRCLRLTRLRVVAFALGICAFLLAGNLLVLNQVKVSTGTPLVSQRPLNVPASLSDNGMAACLLVMDDNHLLIEWLAYHYHTLPLRYLVVAVDPRSQTRPTAILDRYTSNGLTNLTIVQWDTDEAYVTATELAEAEAHVRRYFGRQLSPELLRHRARQRMFYYKCLEHVKAQGVYHWTALVDTDEYLTLSYQTIRNYGRQEIPPTTEAGSVLRFLHQEFQRPDTYPNISKTPCIQIPRIRFGAQESTPGDVEKEVPTGFSGQSFGTLRWRKHASEENYNLNRISKTLIDVSRVDAADLQPIDSIHRPIRSFCGHRKLHIRKSEQVLAIHHYAGTWEQYSFRDDARQGKERSKKVRVGGTTTTIKWMRILRLASSSPQTEPPTLTHLLPW